MVVRGNSSTNWATPHFHRQRHNSCSPTNRSSNTTATPTSTAKSPRGVFHRRRPLGERIACGAACRTSCGRCQPQSDSRRYYGMSACTCSGAERNDPGRADLPRDAPRSDRCGTSAHGTSRRRCPARWWQRRRCGNRRGRHGVRLRASVVLARRRRLRNDPPRRVGLAHRLISPHAPAAVAHSGRRGSPR